MIDPYNHFLSVDATIMVSKNYSIIGERIVIIFVTLYVTIATAWVTKNTLNSYLKYLYFENGMAKTFNNYYQILISRIRCN